MNSDLGFLFETDGNSMLENEEEELKVEILGFCRIEFYIFRSSKTINKQEIVFKKGQKSEWET